jgi:hypothetical protein
LSVSLEIRAPVHRRQESEADPKQLPQVLSSARTCMCRDRARTRTSKWCTLTSEEEDKVASFAIGETICTDRNW